MPTAESNARFSPLADVVRRIPSPNASSVVSPLVVAGFVPLGTTSPVTGTAAHDASLPQTAAFDAAPFEPAALAIEALTGSAPREDEALPFDTLAAGSQVRLFGARLADALDAATAVLVERLAADVLGRELEIAPVAIAAIAKKLVAAYLDEGPLTVRISAADRAAVALDGIPVVVDSRLRAGDCIVDIADGSHDASLGIRLSAVIGAACTR